MALTAEEFCNSPPQGSSHSQESGQAGLSANLTHTFSDSFENTELIAIKESSVRPIRPQEEQNLSEVALGHSSSRKVRKEELFNSICQEAQNDLTKTHTRMEKKEGSRRSTQKRVRTTAVVIRFLVAVVLLPDCVSSSDLNGGSCFTCNHTDCKTLHSIYGENDKLLYQSPLHIDSRTGCSSVDALSNSCLPCFDRFPVIIRCSSNITYIEAEGDHGKLEVLRCEQENTSSHGGLSKGSTHGHFGLYPAIGSVYLNVKLFA
ncbi:hypothetical protein OJAV_G00163070 [Oryzias javanicus]|uniref:Uncharacterized protein n=1 Tax=Oryzias javanicus TaxID=123683 RepID=A0A437CKR7_ORYJA|nr:hypothetical protein OJAV_G00163070 [Oryzias javanicus]